MTIQDLGSIGEFIAAIATVLTLAYLAIQVRHNTRALKSSTFQQFSSEMGKNVDALLLQQDLAEIVARAASNQELSAAERIRFEAAMVGSFRRLESVYVQRSLGSIEAEYTLGFEKSIISLLRMQPVAQWWMSAKEVFYQPFVLFVDDQLAEGVVPDYQPSLTTFGSMGNEHAKDA